MSKQLIKEILDSQNKLRTDPTSFIPLLEDMLQHFDNRHYKRPGYATVVTKEGETAVRDAIEFLNTQEPIHALKHHKWLDQAAQDHADDSGTTGSVAFVDSNGSTMSDRIERYCQWEGQIGESWSYRDTYEGGHEITLALLIDDGVQNRGNRDNIFNPEFNYVGIGIAKHSVYGQICVMDYATSVTELSIKTDAATKFSHDCKTWYNRKRSSLLKHSRPSNEDYKQPNEGQILDISQVPKSVRDRIEKMKLGTNAKIRFEDGAYKITYEKPTYHQIRKSHKTETVNKNEFDYAFPKHHDSGKYSVFDRFGGFNEPGGLGDFEKFKEIDDNKDENEPEGYTEKNVETNIKTVNGKTTKKVVTTYKFADGSTKIVNNTKVC